MATLLLSNLKRQAVVVVANRVLRFRLVVVSVAKRWKARGNVAVDSEDINRRKMA